MKPGTEFDVAISVQDASDAKPRIVHRQSFRSSDQVDAVDLRLSFLPLEGTTRGVLLSQDKEIRFCVGAPTYSPAEIETKIPLPLGAIPGELKLLLPVTAHLSSRISEEKEICLMAILAKQGEKPVAIMERFPRAKISVRMSD